KQRAASRPPFRNRKCWYLFGKLEGDEAGTSLAQHTHRYRTVLGQLFRNTTEGLGRIDRLVVQVRYNVARSQPDHRRRPVQHFSNHHTARQVQVPFLLGGQFGDLHPQPIALLRIGTGCHYRLALFRQRTDDDVQRFTLTATHDTQTSLATGLDRTYQMRQVGRHDDGLIIQAENHVAYAQPALGCRPAIHHLSDQRARRTLQPEGFGEVLVHFLNHHAQPTTADLAIGAQLVGHIHGDIDRNSEGQPHEAARTGEYLRVDANHFTLQVEQGPTGVAGVDRHIGLDERYIAFVGEAASGGADDAGGHRMIEAEWRADRQHPLAYLQLAGVSQLDGR